MNGLDRWCIHDSVARYEDSEDGDIIPRYVSRIRIEYGLVLLCTCTQAMAFSLVFPGGCFRFVSYSSKFLTVVSRRYDQYSARSGVEY